MQIFEIILRVSILKKKKSLWFGLALIQVAQTRSPLRIARKLQVEWHMYVVGT